MSGRTVLVVGAGYVGLVAAACLAQHGHTVVCADNDTKKVKFLNEGKVPIREPGLEELLQENLQAQRLSFVTDAATVAAEFVFLCLPTPLGADGTTQIDVLTEVASQIGPALPPDAVVINKSTMPVGGHKAVAAALGRPDVSVASNPEFLSEGNAVAEFLKPDRVVIGAHSERTAERVAQLYDWVEAPIVFTDPTSAEVIKFASNAFLATKVSFVNSLTAVCEAVDANIDDVLAGVGADHRIGASYLKPGPGWGGSCLPKDTRALVSATRQAGYVFDLLEGAIQANEQQMERVIAKVAQAVGVSESGGSSTGLDGVCVAVLGLTFKAGTDDLRGSPAVEIVRRLAERGAQIQAFDPALAQAQLKQARPDQPELTGIRSLRLCNSAIAAAQGADVVTVLTEWQEFVDLDWCEIAAVMDAPRVVDARNLLDPIKLSGFDYVGLGNRH